MFWERPNERFVTRARSEVVRATRHGNIAARDELIVYSGERLKRLSYKMLQDFPRLQRWMDADDVCQGAVLRLMQALRSVTPATLPDFFRLATRQIRRELLDLTRLLLRPRRAGG